MFTIDRGLGLATASSGAQATQKALRLRAQPEPDVTCAHGAGFAYPKKIYILRGI